MTNSKIITICGSSRFIELMAAIAWLLERDEGAIVLSLHLLPTWFCEVADHFAEHEGVAEQMDDLHLRKIDLADEIFVVDYDGYIGESTAREIEYAEKRRIPIRYYKTEMFSGELANLPLQYLSARAEAGE